MTELTVEDYRRLIYSRDWLAYQDPEIPEWIDPVGQILERHMGTAIEAKPALIADGEAISYGALVRLAQRVHAGLAAAGVEPEHRILLFGTDSLDYVAMWLGALRVGAIPAVVSDLYKASDLAYFITDTAARVLFIDAEQTGKLAEIAAELPASLRTIIVRGTADTAGLATLTQRQVLSFADVRSEQGPAPAAHMRHSNDITYMFYSGGTTGAAKGITHLAYDFIVVPARHGRLWDYRPSDVVYATSKKYFTHGVWPGLFIPLSVGATAVIVRDPPRPDVVLDQLARHAVTKWVTVPTVIKNVLVTMRGMKVAPKFPALTFAVSASEKIPPQVFAEFHDRFGIEMHDSIGSSEISYEWISNRPNEFKRGSLGRPVFGCEVKLVDPDGHEIRTPDIPGECWIKSRTACFFYWRKYGKCQQDLRRCCLRLTGITIKTAQLTKHSPFFISQTRMHNS